jgi:hypothetical protein
MPRKTIAGEAPADDAAAPRGGGLQGGCDQRRLINALIATWMWQRIEKRLRLKSVRRVGPARLTRRHRARAGSPNSPIDGEAYATTALTKAIAEMFG